MKKRSSSVGIISLQKQLTKNGQVSKTSNRLCLNFQPFQVQRNLGKLIKQEQKSKKDVTLMDINFMNFRKFYNRQKIVAEAQYSKLTRDPQQRDMITNQGWNIKSLAPLSSSSVKKFKKSCMRECCNKKIEKGQLQAKKQNKFDKIDENLYHKISKAEPIINNPEIHQLFQHYVEACELNQNIRRNQLTTKRKY